MFKKPHANLRSRTAAGRKPPQGVRTLIRWHRRIGLSAALAIFLLSLTGIALNHVDDLYSQNEYVTSQWLLDWYDIEAPRNSVVNTEQLPTVAWFGGTLVIGRTPIKFNQEPLVAVFRANGFIYSFSKYSLSIATEDARMVEHLTLPLESALRDVIVLDQRLVILKDAVKRHVIFDLDALSVAIEAPSFGDQNAFAQQGLSQFSEKLTPEHKVYRQSRHYSLLKTKVLLDLHSGQFFGPFGKWLMDFFALCFLLLSITGIVVWWRRR